MRKPPRHAFQLLFFISVVFTFALAGCRSQENVGPTIYLLNHKHWTTVLVLNFDTAVAPVEDRGRNIVEGAPQLQPAFDGVWRWQDPSRLVFFPSKKTISPDIDLKISLAGVKFHPNAKIQHRTFKFHTPKLQIVRQDCRWIDSQDAPLRRAMDFALEFNYPLELNYPNAQVPFNASMDNGTAVSIHASGTTLVRGTSEQFVRPAKDMQVNASFKSGTVRLVSLDKSWPEVKLGQGAQCQLKLNRADWDKFDARNNQAPTASDISLSVKEGKIYLSLKGKSLLESAMRVNAGQVLTDGVTITPPVKGVWSYAESATTDSEGNSDYGDNGSCEGDSCEEFDREEYAREEDGCGEYNGGDETCDATTPEDESLALIFTPESSDPLKPGISYDITLSETAFPKIAFIKKQLAAELQIPPMTALFTETGIWGDPKQPGVKRITATLQFSYPVDRDKLNAGLSLKIRRLPANSFAEPLPFEIGYDEKKPDLAYVKSSPLRIGNEPSEIRLEVAKGLLAAVGGEPLAEKVWTTQLIPSALDYLQITDLTVNTVIKENDSLERILIMQSNVALNNPERLGSSVQVYVLPDCRVKSEERLKFCLTKGIIEWQSPDQVDDEILKASVSLPVTWRDSGSEDKTIQHFAFSAPEKRQLFVRVLHGVSSVDGFTLGKDARFLRELGENKREVKILHEGALLSLSGDKKLGVTTRGVNKVHVELQRVLPHNIHHFANFTYGNFANPYFTWPIEHFAEHFTYDENLPAEAEMQRQFFAVDFTRFSKSEEMPQGLFVLTVAEIKPKKDLNCEADSGNESGSDCSPEEEEQTVVQDKRLVLLTDLGILVKTASDGQQNIFVMSFRSGLPVPGVKVSLQGKNGVAVFSAETDGQGQAKFPTTTGLLGGKTPTVYIAEKNGDMSFLPFNRSNRQIDISRFDIGGQYDEPDSLQAFLFSDRGVYRPGDRVNLGMILRRRDWSALPEGLPLKLIIRDPEYQEIWGKVLNFSNTGFEEVSWMSSASGKTGTYHMELIVADKSKKLLGSTKVRVEEFQPDRLQVKTDIVGAPLTGWLMPDSAKAVVTVRNLFGTVASGNVAKLELTARPWLGQVPGYKEYNFRRSIPENIPDSPQPLGEVITDEKGEAIFELPLGAIAEPVYEITLAGEGFEKGSGRSVVGVTSALVSRQPYQLGYRADGPLDYIGKGSKRSVKLVAIGPDFKVRKGEEVRETISAELYENRYVSTLVKRDDGLFQYQSVKRQELRQTFPVTLQSGLQVVSLSTETPGQFVLVFKDSLGEELNRLVYTVAGDGNVSRSLERNAELNLTLDKPEYEPGDTLEVQIVAPYQGGGLITVEQNGVLTSQWFKAETTATTHRVRLPENISGNAYLSVAFVRSLESQEIYMSPLSYGVVPFNISKARYVQPVKLEVPEKVQPGKVLEVKYQVAEDTRLVIYAVDEGILQFAQYQNPAPLDYFFRKRALRVVNHQILDMILPDFALVQKISAPGGDGDSLMLGKYKNPFARRNKPPMAFWSGLIEATPGEGTVQIPVPDYFNGKIRVIAVAVNQGKLATPVSQTVASQAYVIQAQQPWVVAPGDEFEVGVLVANNSGSKIVEDLKVSLEAGAALELLSEGTQILTLADGADGTVRFKARAKDVLGPVALQYQVHGSEDTAELSEEMSVRPAQPLLTTLQSGVLTIEEQRKGKGHKISQAREMFDEQRYTEVAVSVTPAAYLRGMVEYLKNYPYGCTEQITSQAFPGVVLGANTELGLSETDVKKLLERSIAILQTRQKHDGSFGYWTASDVGQPFYSMYATHLLLEASERGYEIPGTTLARALAYADSYARSTQYDSYSHQSQAYAFYLLARSGRNVAERLRAFEAELGRQSRLSGQPVSSRTRFFLGAVFKLHHLDSDADGYFAEFQQRWLKTGLLPSDMQNNPEDLSLYLYLVGKHLPEVLSGADEKFGRYLQELGQDLVKQRMNSFRGSMALIGLGNYWDRFAQEKDSGFTVAGGNPLLPIELAGKSVKTAQLSPSISPLELDGSGKWNLYYQLTESGYDKTSPEKIINQQLTIGRQLLDEKGNEVQQIGLEDKLHIRLALHPDKAMNNIAVVVLVPGGFEIDITDQGLAQRKSLPIKDKPLWQPDYIDVQEDRIVMFGAFDGSEKYFEFRLKPLNAGTYQVPSLFAEGMYDSEVLYRGLADVVRVMQ
ncbi:MAG: alpha-2-macroglobulin [bacterium]|nr:alpha-2-macroglobulin [bacterium]